MKKLLLATIILIIIIYPQITFAQTYKCCPGGISSSPMCTNSFSSCEGITCANTGFSCVQTSSAITPSKPVSLDNPLTGQTGASNVNSLIGQIINGILGIVGSLALVMFIYGGFVWMTAAGNNERVTKGKDILIWAALGLVIIFTSYALVKFVLVNVLGG